MYAILILNIIIPVHGSKLFQSIFQVKMFPKTQLFQFQKKKTDTLLYVVCKTYVDFPTTKKSVHSIYNKELHKKTPLWLLSKTHS